MHSYLVRWYLQGNDGGGGRLKKILTLAKTFAF